MRHTSCEYEFFYSEYFQFGIAKRLGLKMVLKNFLKYFFFKEAMDIERSSGLANSESLSIASV